MDNIDNPYMQLALNLVAELSEKELSEILHNTKAIKRRITREVNNADFYGDFLDCIMVDLVRQNREREIGKHLSEASEFFYKELDIPRLRRCILFYCCKFGKHIV